MCLWGRPLGWMGETLIDGCAFKPIDCLQQFVRRWRSPKNLLADYDCGNGRDRHVVPGMAQRLAMALRIGSAFQRLPSFAGIHSRVRGQFDQDFRTADVAILLEERPQHPHRVRMVEPPILRQQQQSKCLVCARLW